MPLRKRHREVALLRQKRPPILAPLPEGLNLVRAATRPQDDEPSDIEPHAEEHALDAKAALQKRVPRSRLDDDGQRRQQHGLCDVCWEGWEIPLRIRARCGRRWSGRI
ncbi:hypothetical protein MMC06_003073 [Schaereria dolodes]|nr:hypothetical protein [Schaereria dolodes]